MHSCSLDAKIRMTLGQSPASLLLSSLHSYPGWFRFSILLPQRRRWSRGPSRSPSPTARSPPRPPRTPSASARPPPSSSSCMYACLSLVSWTAHRTSHSQQSLLCDSCVAFHSIPGPTSGRSSRPPILTTRMSPPYVPLRHSCACHSLVWLKSNTA